MSTQGPTLWAAVAEDAVGPAALRVTEQESDHLGVSVVLEDGRVVGVALDRIDVQELRAVLTTWLVDVAPVVGMP